MKHNFKKMTKKFLSICLSGILTLGISFPNNYTYAEPSGVSDLLNSYIGNTYDVDGAYGAQCTDLIFRYVEDLFGFNSFWSAFSGGGNALSFYNIMKDEYFEKIPNSVGDTSNYPQIGDIIVYNANKWTPYGHVGIVTWADGYNVQYIDQNGGGRNEGVTTRDGRSGKGYNYNSCIGWLRPRYEKSRYNNSNNNDNNINENTDAGIDLGYSFEAYIVNTGTGRYLTANGNNVETTSNSNDRNILWRFNQSDDGWYYIENVNRGLTLDVSNASTAAGTNVQLYKKHGDINRAQRWRIYGSQNNAAIRSQLTSSISLDEHSDTHNIYMYLSHDGYQQRFKIINLEEQRREEQQRQERLRQEQQRQEQQRQEQQRQEQQRQKQLRQEQLKQEQLKQEKLRQEQLKQEQLKQEQLKQEKLRQEQLKQEQLKQEKLRQEQLKQEKLRQEQLNQQYQNQQYQNQQYQDQQYQDQQYQDQQYEQNNYYTPTNEYITIYSDVSPTSNYAQSINYVTQENIMSGVGNGKFAPKKNVQRAMITQILYNYSGRPTINYYRKFSDVKSNSWYANSVIWASSNNIVNGYNNKFSPNNDITLEQVITILYNFAQSKGLNVNVGYNTSLQEYNVDIQKMSSYAKTPMEWAAANGIINTYEPGKIVPKKKINREELSMIFQNYMRYLQNGE